MNNIVAYLITLIVLAFLTFILIKKIIANKDNKIGKVSGKLSKERILELKKRIAKDENDYEAIYELAMLEENIGENEEALKKYEQLMEIGYLRGKAQLDAAKKLEEKYSALGNRENILKYSAIVFKIDPKNTIYAIKAAVILTYEGNFKIACDYFSKALSAKEDFDIEDIKAAAFAFYKVKDYKKSLAFLETLYKRINKEKGNKELSKQIAKSLISLYLISEEINIAKSFLEITLADKFHDDNYKFYLDKIYLFVLYKLEDSKLFKEYYDKLYSIYKIPQFDKKISALIFDYAFYSYFLRDIDFSIQSFRTIKSFNLNDFNLYDVDKILSYLSEIYKASDQLNKIKDSGSYSLQKYKNDNFENYIDKDLTAFWDKTINLWEASFIDFDYISTLIDTKPTINVDAVLNQLKISVNENKVNTFTTTNKIDKIFKMSIFDFKKVCQNIIRNKLSHSIVQEYTGEKGKNSYGDEVDYLAYNMKSNKKDLTLISFKRWNNVEIGELMIRDFLMLVSEAGAKNGILIVPVDLTSSAKSYVLHNDRIEVYSRAQFNNLLKDESI